MIALAVAVTIAAAMATLYVFQGRRARWLALARLSELVDATSDSREQALNTGHDGGISTIHANAPRDALARLETMVLMAGIELPSRAVREQIVSAIHLVVHVRRYDDGIRRVESIAEITGMEGTTPLMQELFVFRRRGRQGRRVAGYFTATGVVPHMADELREEGVTIPASLFQPSEGEP